MQGVQSFESDVDSYKQNQFPPRQQAMFSLVRKVVAGPKKTTTFQGGQLDLTYITERVVAMAFPASDLLEKAYRNPIEDVVAYFNERHPNNYLIVNVSSRLYDYTAFDGRVKDYEWPDHQAPPLTTLIQIGYEIFRYLKDFSERVVAVHCNHGKGRTGTAIISFMLLVGYSDSALECLKQYNSRRFNKDTYGVDQPCQLRYLSFVEKLINVPKINPKLICYRLKGVTHKGLDSDYFVKIKSTRGQTVIFQKVDFGVKIGELEGNLLLSDIFIEIYSNTWKGSKKIARINYNLYFCQENLHLTFKGKDIKLSDNHHPDFEITLHLQYFCLCHLPSYEETVCNCKSSRELEEGLWGKMIASIKECKKISSKEMVMLLSGKKIKPPKAYHRNGDSQEKEVQVEGKKVAFRSFSKKNFRSAHQEKLASLVQHTLQQKLLEGSKENGMEEFERIRQLSGEIDELENLSTQKINKEEEKSIEH